MYAHTHTFTYMYTLVNLKVSPRETPIYLNPEYHLESALGKLNSDFSPV